VHISQELSLVQRFKTMNENKVLTNIGLASKDLPLDIRKKTLQSVFPPSYPLAQCFEVLAGMDPKHPPTF